MKKFILLTLILLAAAGRMQASNILVAYFSWGGNTSALAEEICRQTGADIYRIEPAVPYSTDYNTVAYTVSRNEKESNARPVLKETGRDFSAYDYIFVGCPVWWFDAPMIIHTFLEAYGFAGKTVIPFCTFATATYETLNDITRATPSAKHLEGLGVRGASSYDSNAIGAWLERIGLKNGATGIREIEPVDRPMRGGIYNILGQKVRDGVDTRGLRPGIYIMDGRKFYVSQ